jgi:hypothetical protein
MAPFFDWVDSVFLIVLDVYRLANIFYGSQPPLACTRKEICWDFTFAHCWYFFEIARDSIPIGLPLLTGPNYESQ